MLNGWVPSPPDMGRMGMQAKGEKLNAPWTLFIVKWGSFQEGTRHFSPSGMCIPAKTLKQTCLRQQWVQFAKKLLIKKNKTNPLLKVGACLLQTFYKGLLSPLPSLCRGRISIVPSILLPRSMALPPL